MNTYVFADGATEPARLRALEALLDPTTIEVLTRLGLGPGQRVLEVGAGAGSITRWLSGRVGPDGRVTAIDIDPRHVLLDRVEDNVEVVRHDIVADAPLPGLYDLVHARYVLEHVSDPATAVAAMAAMLKPGGWLVLATSDPATAWLGLPEHPDVQALRAAFDQIFDDTGGDSYLGRTLPSVMAACGLVDIDGAASARFLPSWTSDEALSYRLSVDAVAQRLVTTGLLRQVQLESALRILRTRPAPFLNHLTITVWGRRRG